jgi:hypothetical protein
MEIINALLNANIYTLYQIVVGWIKEQKKQEKITLEDLFVLGVISQSVEL